MEAQGGQQQWMMSAQPQPQFAYAAPPPPPQPYHQPSSHEEVRTLWIGDLPYWADESYLHSWFAATNEVLSIKVIRNKATGLPEGYGFVEFASHGTAERVLQSYNGTQIPGTELTFRLNWASSGIGERRPDAGPEHSIFVGRSKGYGFVKFADEMEKNRAMTEMNGIYCSTRPMRISAATPKKTTVFQQQYVAPKGGLYTAPVPTIPVDNDITNTTIYIGNLDPVVTEEELRQIFLQFGEIVYVKIPAAKGCGFVQFTARTSAEEAIQRMHGSQIGQLVVHLSWGKSTTAKQDPSGVWNPQADPNQWGSAYYGYGQGYDAYAYGATQDPSLYAYGAYGGYMQYPQQGEGGQDMGGVTGVAPPLEQREEIYDPLATPDVDKLNSAYVAIHGSAILGRPLWQKTSPFSIHA
ncbi:polyadenylate-binding protein RBP47B' isoform X3 [Cynara cardunculus var. scolymus]|uniref:polyadenylate-binding protein RBP47B' isoform X3 n=1 Tax=Cynara cardunculus var. scolymus TaxID=59895 RepID=UPI000D626D40|nr:polyadenylate-binding protein RBP47B' isoform X3 [Cynara cardunculus var. scolymus]